VLAGQRVEAGIEPAAVRGRQRVRHLSVAERDHGRDHPDYGAERGDAAAEREGQPHRPASGRPGPAATGGRPRGARVPVRPPAAVGTPMPGMPHEALRSLPGAVGGDVAGRERCITKYDRAVWLLEFWAIGACRPARWFLLSEGSRGCGQRSGRECEHARQLHQRHMVTVRRPWRHRRRQSRRPVGHRPRARGSSGRR